MENSVIFVHDVLFKTESFSLNKYKAKYNLNQLVWPHDTLYSQLRAVEQIRWVFGDN